MAEMRLVHAVDRNVDLAAVENVADVALLARLLDGPLNQRLGPAQKQLAVGETLASRIQSAVDDVHSRTSMSASRLV
jgi:hypothetical protein